MKEPPGVSKNSPSMNAKVIIAVLAVYAMLVAERLSRSSEGQRSSLVGLARKGRLFLPVSAGRPFVEPPSVRGPSRRPPPTPHCVAALLRRMDRLGLVGKKVAMVGSKSEEDKAVHEPQVRTLRVRGERKATARAAAPKRPGSRTGSHNDRPTVRAETPAPLKTQASKDYVHQPHESTTVMDVPKMSPTRSPSPRQMSRHSSSLYRRKTTESTTLTGIRGWWRRMWGESEDRSRGVSYLIRIYERERAEKACRMVYACLFALFLTLFAYFLAHMLSTGTIVRVRTGVGLVSGELHSVLKRNVFYYLGIPYASKPPRFQRAEPLDRLQINLIVPQFPGVRCMQVVENGSNTTWPESDVYGGLSKPWYSEDCLYLNIWSPAPPCDYTSDTCPTPAPVVVVIFSLGFARGGADWYDGSLLASLGGVVVVAPNFRLGPLAVPLKEDQPQNVPLLSLEDQMLAIQWTQHNIKYFGGNSSQITLMGAGGGAWTVGEMVLSNRGNVRDIVKRVILHGGSPLQRYAPFRAYLVEKAIGCGPASSECLDVADISQLAGLASQRVLGPSATLVVAEGRQDHGIDVLVGYVPGQGRRLALDILLDIANELSSNASDEETLAKVQEYLNFTSLTAIFYKLRSSSASPIDVWPRFLEYLLISCPIELISDLYQAIYARTYGFVYEQETRYPDGVGGAPFPDVDMVFGVPLVSSAPAYPEHMKETSLKFINVWSTFIKKGRLPSVDGNPWPVMIENTRWTAVSVVIKDGMKLSAPARSVHKTCEDIDNILLGVVNHPDADSSEFATDAGYY
ncbi:hypothetical protein HPB50_019139 [Hyalomma asiaticum]|uniref:Uncharacterized protein n=1 Tax=Hyalomma asiaticum TaxID=266040 RepID=A0ACB7SFI0_HYAAI|nr:hypothetical protein HPB50_019139 [Hyalomma asiaticum]